MVPEIQVILPRSPSGEYLVSYVRIEYQIWREDREISAVKWKPENVRFSHDPNWRNRLMSIQCIHDSIKDGPSSFAGVFWVSVVAPLFALGGVSLALNFLLMRLVK